MILAAMAAYVALLVASTVLQQRFPRATLAAFAVGPLLLTPLWLRLDHSFSDVFAWVKLYSVCVAVVWFNAFRVSPRFAAWRWARHGVVAILLVNIAEAVVSDLAEGRYANALSGTLVGAMLVVMYGPRGVSLQGERANLCWATSLPWIAAYTVWNVVFAAFHYPFAVLEHAAVLLAALVVSVRAPQLWLQARAITLGVHLVAVFTAEAAVHALRVDWQPERWAAPLQYGSLAISVAVTVMALRQRRLAPQTG